METLSVEERLGQPDFCQEMWYRLLVPWAHRRTVIEVGAGTGYGVDILRNAGASAVHGLDPLPLRSDVIDTPFLTVNPRSYDLSVACDVIEHVEEDEAFLAQLLKVAREFAFFSTPNWNVSHAENEYHVREYTPEELRTLLARHVPERRCCTFFSSDAERRIRVASDLRHCENNFGVLIDVSERSKWWT
jgi:hypothetical protein